MFKKYDFSSIFAIKFAFLFVVFCNVVVDVTHKVLLQNIAFKVFDGSEQVIWISLINALIIIPFLLLFSTSGYLSDRYSKKNILIYGAVSSFCLSFLMILAYYSSNFYLAMFVLLLLAAQSAIYSPAKFGIIVDIYGKKNLSKGNSALQAVSIIAILFSIAIASFAFEVYFSAYDLGNLSTKEELLSAILPLTYFILPVAFLEMMTSLLILKNINISSSHPDVTLDTKQLLKGKLLKRNISAIFSNNIIFLSVIGLSVFWAISQGVLAVFPSYAKEYLHINNVFIINLIIGISGVGIAIGSLIYSKLSKHYIELGTIPLAALGMALSIFAAIVLKVPFFIAIAFLFFGIFGGLFVVPLNALIQFNSPKKSLGTILAGNNWFHSIFMFVMLCITSLVSFYNIDPLVTIYLILCITIVGTFYTVLKLPQSLILFFLKVIVGFRYKLEVNGIKNIPSEGGVLLLGNHVSWIDWAIVLMSTPRSVRFVMYKPIYQKWYLSWIFKMFKVIPISNLASKNTMKMIAKQLDDGEIIVLFPEGAITRNGHLGEFKKGFEKILNFTEDEDIKVIPFYIRGLWESLFSRANKTYKNSKKVKTVTISFGKEINKEKASSVKVKNEIIELSTKAWQSHIREIEPLNEVIFNRLKQVGKDMSFADSTGLELNGYRFLTVSILFKQKLEKLIKEQNVGLLMPSTAAGAFINYAVMMMGKTSVNLNYTSEMSSIKAAIQSAEIKTVVSSKKFMAKLDQRGIQVREIFKDVNVIFVEDIKEQISRGKGILTYFMVKFLPTFLLRDIYLRAMKKDAIVTILFSSGSEGKPKGVMLSGDNILGNCQQIGTLVNANEDDIIVGSLPLFHAFGIVVTTYFPLVEGVKCVAHPDPTDGFGLGKIVSDYKATIMFGTSTFFRLYTRNSKVNEAMFKTLRFTIAGAEKLRKDVREDFKAKFGKEILEGYGATETSPVTSCCIPNVIAPDGSVQVGNKTGTVGMPLPGTTVKIVDPDTFEELEVNEEGMIVVSGIQVMNGYLKDKEKTAQAIRKIGDKYYYVTGDKGKLDEDGFITIVDRYSRFAKLGGEMVSLGAIEEKIAGYVKEIDESEEIDFVATSIEDDKKGEKVVLLLSKTDDDVISKLKSQFHKIFDNKLMVPSLIKMVDEIPKLGSGKKDLKGAKDLAKEDKKVKKEQSSEKEDKENKEEKKED